MLSKYNFISLLLSSDKFVGTFVPLAGSAVFHVTVFAAVLGFFGWGDHKSASPEVIAIELVRLDAPALSKGSRDITDRDGAVSQKKQLENAKVKTKNKILATPLERKEKAALDSHNKSKKLSPVKSKKQKMASRAKPGSQQQLKGMAKTDRTHGPKFSGKGLSNPRPSYPHSARSKGQSGRVVLKVRVSPKGRAMSVRVSKSSGVKALDSSAMKAVKRWRFYPARKNGRAVTGIVYTPITFRLVN